MSPESSSSLETLLKEADNARQRQWWDEAVKLHQAALKAFPDETRLRLGLAQSYEGKARQTGLNPFFLMALQEYWRLVNANPGDVKAVDGLLAAAYNAGQLDEVMEEFRSRMNQHPDVEAYKTTFKKIETLFLFSAEPRKPTAPGPQGILHVLAGKILPFVALACFLGWFFLRLKAGPNGDTLSPTTRLMESVLSRFSVFAILGYLFYQGYLRLRSSR